MSVSSAATLTHHPHRHTTHHSPGGGAAARRRSSHMHRTSSHVGVHSTASALALTSTTTEAPPRMERADSGQSRGSDDVSVTSAPARLRSGKHAGAGVHVARPGVGVRRKSQVHLVGDHSKRGARNSRSDTNLSRLGLTSLARVHSKTRVVKDAEEEEEEWEEAPAANGERDDESTDDDGDGDGDQLVIQTKGRKKAAPKQNGEQRIGFRPAPEREPTIQPTTQRRSPSPPPRTPAPTTTVLPTLAAERNPSPVPSEAGTLIATPTRPTPAQRHVRTRNSHTSLRSLAAGSLRSLFAGPHHPLSSPTSATAAPSRREAAAPPVVSGEVARGAWAFSGESPGVQGLPASPTSSNARLPAGRPNAATASLRKASFTGPMADPSGLPSTTRTTGRLSAHSVAQKAAQLPTVGSRPAFSGNDATRQQQERESVNLVSRFITLPTASAHTGDANSGVFPDSPFAGAHASLVRTLMEEGARILPVEPSTAAASFGGASAPGARRTDTNRTTLARTQRTTSTFPAAPTAAGGSPIPYGASPAPTGQEWVLGLTPFEMSVQRCLEQRKSAVRLATGRALGPLGA